MAYEFKDMATLDVVETVADDATVLIEESGVIKRAPKSEVGGTSSNNETPDMVITIAGRSSRAINSEIFSITDGSIENVFTAFHEGRYPKVKIRFHMYDNDAYAAIREEYDASVCTYGENLWIKVITVDPYSSYNINCQCIYLNSDGSLSAASLAQANLTTVQ